MPRPAADENFNGEIVRGLVRRKPRRSMSPGGTGAVASPVSTKLTHKFDSCSGCRLCQRAQCASRMEFGTAAIRTWRVHWPLSRWLARHLRRRDPGTRAGLPWRRSAAHQHWRVRSRHFPREQRPAADSRRGRGVGRPARHSLAVSGEPARPTARRQSVAAGWQQQRSVISAAQDRPARHSSMSFHRPEYRSGGGCGR